MDHEKEETKDGVDLLKCLCSSLRDKEGKTLLKRHTLLMYHYMKLRESGIKLGDLPYLKMVLEFFSDNLVDIKQYYVLLWRCLRLLHKPILLHKPTDLCFAKDCYTSLFCTLGNCLYAAADTAIHLMILDVILFMITHARNNPDEISIEIRIEALKSSYLLEIMASLLYFSPNELYICIIEIMYQLSLQPYFANLLVSLNCMDIWIRRISIKNDLSANDAAIKETTSNLLWSSIRNAKVYESLSSPRLNSTSLSILRGWLRREVLVGQQYERNSVSALVLQYLLSLPQLEVSRSGILPDIGLLAVATEFGTANSWASRVKFKPTKDDLDFKKILFTILLLAVDNPIAKMVLAENRFLNCMAFLLDFQNFKGVVRWNQNQHIELINISLFALPLLSKHFKQEYTRSGATARILQIIHYFTYKEQNLHLVKKCCLCLHLLLSSGISLNHFRTVNVIPVLMNLIFYMMNTFQLNLLVQMIMSFCFCVITNLVQDHNESKTIFGKEMKILSTLIFKRLQDPQLSDSKTSSSFLISVCDFVWQSTVANDQERKIFIDELGVYLILNVMEAQSDFGVHLMFLGMLADLCTDPRCIPQIVTWRGKNGNTFLRFICALWRKQENMKGVSRDENGCIEDIEFALVGQEQKKSSREKDSTGSPALVDMIGCARPKIALLAGLISRRHFEKVYLAKSVYQVPFDAFTTEDEITYQVIMCYEPLKLGEILWEVQKAVNKTGVVLLPLDITALHQLTMKQVGLANKIQKNQKLILQLVKKKELEEEHKLYNVIREANLTHTLKKTFKFDSYMTISNALYKKIKYMKYESLMNEMDATFGNRKNEKNFHKTFSVPRNFFLLKTGRNVHIRSIARKIKINEDLQISDNSEHEVTNK